MPRENVAVLTRPGRIAAVERGRQALPTLAIPLDSIARLAARLLNAPMGVVTLVGCEEQHLVGMYNLPPVLTSLRRTPLAYSVCKYVVSEDHPVLSSDMAADPDLRDHKLLTEHRVGAFAGVPLRDVDDEPLGALSVLDTRARPWAVSDMATLVEIAETIGPIRPLPPPADTTDTTGMAAEERDAFFTALLNSLDTGALGCTTSGEVVMLNRALRQIYGLPPDRRPASFEDIVGGQLFRPDGTPLPLHETAMRRALNGEPAHDRHVVVRVPGRAERAFVVRGQPVGDPGQRVGAVVALHDVTAVRRAERFADCGHRVMQALTDGGTAREWAPRVLEAVCGALGWSHAELWLTEPATESLSLAGCWTAPGRTVPATATRTAADQGISGAVLRTGRPHWVADLVESAPGDEGMDRYLAAGLRTALALPVHGGQLPVGVLACFSDAPESDEALLTALVSGIAAQVGQFLARSSSERLTRELTRSRRDFITLVGHEIRTPLTSILSYAQMLLDHPDVAAEHRNAMVGVVHRNAGALQTVINTLLDFAAVQAGSVHLEQVPVDLSILLTDALADLEPSERMRIRRDVTGRPTVNGDPARLRQVIDHLLSNAVTYSPDGGQVWVRLAAERGTVVCTVADEGIGIPADERARVFTPFFRSSTTRLRGIPGTGLGLAAVRAVVERHGGTATLDEHHRPGTSITVRLPQLPHVPD